MLYCSNAGPILASRAASSCIIVRMSARQEQDKRGSAKKGIARLPLNTSLISPAGDAKSIWETLEIFGRECRTVSLMLFKRQRCVCLPFLQLRAPFASPVWLHSNLVLCSRQHHIATHQHGSGQYTSCDRRLLGLSSRNVAPSRACHLAFQVHFQGLACIGTRSNVIS